MANPPIKRYPEAPRDRNLSFDAPRRVHYSTEVRRNKSGEPVGRTTWVSTAGRPAEQHPAGDVVWPKQPSSQSD